MALLELNLTMLWSFSCDWVLPEFLILRLIHTEPPTIHRLQFKFLPWYWFPWWLLLQETKIPYIYLPVSLILGMVIICPKSPLRNAGRVLSLFQFQCHDFLVGRFLFCLFSPRFAQRWLLFDFHISAQEYPLNKPSWLANLNQGSPHPSICSLLIIFFIALIKLELTFIYLLGYCPSPTTWM